MDDSADNPTLKLNSGGSMKINSISYQTGTNSHVPHGMMAGPYVFDANGNLEEIQLSTDCDACEALMKFAEVDDNDWYDFLIDPVRHDESRNCVRGQLLIVYSKLGYTKPMSKGGNGSFSGVGGFTTPTGTAVNNSGINTTPTNNSGGYPTRYTRSTNSKNVWTRKG